MRLLIRKVVNFLDLRRGTARSLQIYVIFEEYDQALNLDSSFSKGFLMLYFPEGSSSTGILSEELLTFSDMIFKKAPHL